MRILHISSVFPFPLTSGYLRQYFLIQGLSARGHAITLLAIAGPRFEPGHAAAVQRFAERVITFPSSTQRGGIGGAALRARSLVGGPAADQAVQAMRETARRLIAEERFDVVLLSGKQAFAVGEALEGVPLVADVCDAGSMRLKGALRYARPGRLILSVLDCAHVRRIEHETVRRAARLVFASARDRDALVGATPVGCARASVVPNGVDLSFWQRNTAERGRDTIAFTGVMSYPPNADAALHLIEDVLPLVRRSVPAAKLLIVGRNPSRRLMHAAKRSATEVTGFVDDVRPFLERATVFAAPLRFGAGIQNKVLEAMAMEVPAVVSPLVAEGLSPANGPPPPLRIASEPKEFADALIGELRLRETNPAPFSEARRYVAAHFQWERSGAALEEVLWGAVHGDPVEASVCSPSL